MHGHRLTKLLARYVLQGPVAINSSPALRTSASLLRTSFFVPRQRPYILTRLIRTLKSFFVSVSIKIAETFPNVSLSTGSLNELILALIFWSWLRTPEFSLCLYHRFVCGAV